MKRLFKTIILTLVIISFSEMGNAHPWGGLVIDAKGNLYFTFICPLVDDDHYACVMKINSASQLEEVLKSRRSPSDIILERTNNYTIYAAERNGSQPNYSNTLWKLEEGNFSQLLNTSNQDLFHIQSYSVDESGRIYFAKGNQIWVKENSDSEPELFFESNERIGLLKRSPTGFLYFMSGDKIYSYKDGTHSLVAKNLKKSDPEDLPFQGANIFFDMVIDKNENIYLAYYGNREVLKLSPSGEVTSILKSEAPWSPHGIDIYDGDLFVLESTIGAGKWWKFWEEDVQIAPRIRKLDTSGNISVIYSYFEE